MNKEIYLECRKILRSFVKKEYWTTFSSADVFYIVDGKDKAIFTFIEQFLGDAFGCQLFFNKSGFNYVHDILTISADNVLTMCDCDSLFSVFVNKNELKPEEKEFLKKNNIKVQENNLIIYRYQQGYRQRMANDKELKILLKYLEFLHSIIANEYDDLLEAFRNTDSAYCLMDSVNYQYSIIYRPIPFLETMPKRATCNKEFVLEFKDSTYVNDECYLFASYIPASTKDKNIRALVFYAYYPNLNKHEYKYIIDEPKEYKNCIYTILYDLFTNIGIPYKMIINSREIYSLIYSTLTHLKIETEFKREYEVVDANLNELIGLIYEKVNIETLLVDEYINLLDESIKLILSFLNGSDELEYLENNEIELVS